MATRPGSSLGRTIPAVVRVWPLRRSRSGRAFGAAEVARVRSAGWLALLAVCGWGCGRLILVGRDEATDGAALRGDASGAAAAPDALALDGSSDDAIDSGLVPLAIPWSTGFENEPDDTWTPGDSSACYATAGASFQIVTSPVHGGQHAAAFTVDTAVASPSQTRCLKQGVLPAAAYYGAWYYVPTQATSTGNWNLLHFQGADVADGTNAHGLWDVSLANASDGTLQTVVYDFLRSRLLQTSTAVPVGAWFHLEVFAARRRRHRRVHSSPRRAGHPGFHGTRDGRLPVGPMVRGQLRSGAIAALFDGVCR